MFISSPVEDLPSCSSKCYPINNAKETKTLGEWAKKNQLVQWWKVTTDAAICRNIKHPKITFRSQWTSSLFRVEHISWFPSEKRHLSENIHRKWSSVTIYHMLLLEYITNDPSSVHVFWMHNIQKAGYRQIESNWSILLNDFDNFIQR